MYYEEKIINGVLMYRITPNGNWRQCSIEKMGAKILELESALKNVHEIICDGASEGFNCHAGDWAERLFHSNQQTSDALGKRNT